MRPNRPSRHDFAETSPLRPPRTQPAEPPHAQPTPCAAGCGVPAGLVKSNDLVRHEVTTTPRQDVASPLAP